MLWNITIIINIAHNIRNRIKGQNSVEHILEIIMIKEEMIVLKKEEYILCHPSIFMYDKYYY